MNPTTELKTKILTGVMDIPISLIQPDPDQPRKAFDPEYITNLGESIKAEGLLQPITVRKNPAAEKFNGFVPYLIVAGECRWRAHCVAGIQSVRCIVSHEHTDERKRFRAQVMENMGRKDMTLREEAMAIAKLIDGGDDEAKVGKAVSLTPQRIRTMLKLASLSDYAWSLAENDKVGKWVLFKVVNLLPETHIERALSACRGRSTKKATIIINQMVTEISQQSLDFVLEESGVAKVEARTRLAMAGIIDQVNTVAKLTKKEAYSFARKMGDELAHIVKPTKENRQAIVFLRQVIIQLDARLGK